jgi:hypothetical protein
MSAGKCTDMLNLLAGRQRRSGYSATKKTLTDCKVPTPHINNGGFRGGIGQKIVTYVGIGDKGYLSLRYMKTRTGTETGTETGIGFLCITDIIDQNKVATLRPQRWKEAKVMAQLTRCMRRCEIGLVESQRQIVFRIKNMYIHLYII